MSFIKNRILVTPKSCQKSSVPLYELAVCSFVSEYQLKDNWFYKFQQFVSKYKIAGEICNFKNKRSNNGAPLLHLNLGTIINGDYYTNQSGNRQFWKEKELYQTAFRQLTATQHENIIFHPKSYRIIDYQLCLAGEVTPNTIGDLKQNLRRNKIKCSRSKRSYIPLMSLTNGDHQNVRNRLKVLSLPSSFSLDNMSLMIKGASIKTNNSVIIEWADLKNHDHHCDHVDGPDDNS